MMNEFKEVYNSEFEQMKGKTHQDVKMKFYVPATETRIFRQSNLVGQIL